MANNIPSAVQTTASKGIRGEDYSDEETTRALAHRDEQLSISKNKTRLLGMLRGSRSAYLNLQYKTLPLADSSPAYEEFP